MITVTRENLPQSISVSAENEETSITILQENVEQSITIEPEIAEQTIEIEQEIGEQEISVTAEPITIGQDVTYYTGQYYAIPLTDTSTQVFATQNKMMTNNFLVYTIPTTETENDAGGVTFAIGE